MKPGYRTTWELLEKAYDAEERLAGRIDEIAPQHADPALEKILNDIARRCRKNGDRIRQLQQDISADNYEVTLRCPICGWGIPFGSNPVIGDESKCELCGVWFRLTEREGDYHLRNVGRRTEPERT